MTHTWKKKAVLSGTLFLNAVAVMALMAANMETLVATLYPRGESTVVAVGNSIIGIYVALAVSAVFFGVSAVGKILNSRERGLWLAGIVTLLSLYIVIIGATTIIDTFLY